MLAARVRSRDSLFEVYGSVAQLVARFVRNEEVRGSNPLRSTTGYSRISGYSFPYLRMPGQKKKATGFPAAFFFFGLKATLARPGRGSEQANGVGLL